MGQPLTEAVGLGLRADQADRGSIAGVQQGAAQVVVELVIVGQDQHMAATAQHRGIADRIVAVQRPDIRRQVSREHLGAGIHQRHLPGQLAHNRHQRLRHVAGAKHHQLRITAGLAFEQHRDAAAAALAQRSAQREVLQHRLETADGQLLAGPGGHQILQMTATDGVPGVFAGNHHLARRLTRHRASDANHGHQHIGLAALLAVGDRLEPAQVSVHHTASCCAACQAFAALTALSMRSGVAGVSSGGQ